MYLCELFSRSYVAQKKKYERGLIIKEQGGVNGERSWK